MFTRSPVTGDRSVITIEGAWGLGSAVVGGEVTPDRWVLGKITGEISVRDISDKLIQHVPRREAGPRASPVPADLRAHPCLSDEQLQALRTIARHGRAALRPAAGHRVGDGPQSRRDTAAAEPPRDSVVGEGRGTGGTRRRGSAVARHVDFWR